MIVKLLRSWPGIVALLALVGTCGLLTARPAAAEDGQTLDWGASIAGVDLRGVDAGSPFELGRADERPFVLTVRNTGTASVTIRSVRVEGRVMGMAFVSNTTRVGITLAPGESTERRFPLYFDDVSEQARGLIPSSLVLVDPDGQRLDSIDFPMKIDGSVFSVYSVFGLAVAGATLVVLGTLFLAIRRGRLPENRWRRASAFLPAGAGIGLTLTFTLSSISLLTPRPSSWVPLLIACAGGAFLLGYFWIRGARPDDEEGTAAGEGEEHEGEGYAGEQDEEVGAEGDLEGTDEPYHRASRAAP